MRNLSKDTEIRTAITIAAGAAAQTAISGLGIDTQGFESVLFIVSVGPVTAGAVTTVKVQQSADDASADAYADLLGTSVAIADDDDNQQKYIDIVKPRERYLRLSVARATQDATVSAVAILYGKRAGPVTQPSGETEGETHISPAEGTA